ncbi:hypothetical protein BDY24DRAFT_102934 [Mrakia frigida]|uniref:uncharacterized protein n=1 Tax=Mrakia frigida TaxID=29902 RepID=UPI003FCC226E
MVRDSSLSVRPLFGLSRLLRFYIADPALSFLSLHHLLLLLLLLSLPDLNSTQPNFASPTPSVFALARTRQLVPLLGLPNAFFLLSFHSSHETVPYSCLLLPLHSLRLSSHLHPFSLRVLPSPSLSSFVLRPFVFHSSFYRSGACCAHIRQRSTWGCGAI